MHDSPSDSIDSTEDGSQLHNDDITREGMEKKISFRWHHILTHLLLGVGLGLSDIIGDIYSSFQLYNQQYEWHYTDRNGYSVWYLRNIAQKEWHFPFSVCLLVIPSFFIACLSLVTYWREEKSKLDLKGWGLLRWACHFPVFVLAPAVRTVDLVVLGHQCESLKEKINLSIHLGEPFKRLKKRDKTLTRIQHCENSFESGPQLFFKMYLLFQHIISGKIIESYGYLNLFFIGIGIGSCAWKSVCNRRSLNFRSDQEKRMSWRKHIIPLLIAHSLSVFVRFTLLGALSAFTLPGFGVFFVIHLIIILYYVVIWDVLLNLAQNRGSCWNQTENMIRLTDILTSSLFSFVEFSTLTEKKWRMRIYYWIPLAENVMLIIICLSMIKMPVALSISTGVALIASTFFLFKCDNFKLIESNKSNSKHSASKRLKGQQIRNRPTLVDGGDYANQEAVSYYPTAMSNDRPILTARRRLMMNRRSDETPVRTLRQRHLPFKEWMKDMTELLRDDRLSDGEKYAIRWKDLNWICGNMKNNLFQVCTLLLAENETNVNAKDEDGMTPTLQLCYCYYDKEDLPNILELFINKGAEVKNVDAADGRTMLHLVCCYYTHRNLNVIVELLVKAGVPVDARDDNGRTALHLLAANYEHNNMKDVVDLLIKARVQVGARDVFGNTALHLLAISYKHNNMKDIVDLLIEKGVPVYAVDKFGYSIALHILAANYEHDNMKDIVDLLIKKGVPVDAKTNIGDTALHLLALSYMHDNMKDVVDLLIKAGVPVDAKNKDGDTALHLLAEFYKQDNMKDIIELLIEKGVPVDVKNNHGNTALHLLATRYKHDNLEDIVTLLKNRGTLLDVQNYLGLTPLMQLCGSKYKLDHSIGLFLLLTPDARDDPHLPDTESVTHLLKEFGEKRISSEDLEDGLNQIRRAVIEKYRKKN